uniref:Dedicator of cytokinesis protein 1 n=1 Tax=Schistocephalus solidus TaxID=70667 RepID=A0A0X3PQ60_SCHSO
MTWLPIQETNKWRCVVSKFSDNFSKSLTLDIGDWVYVQLQCDGWYYGFKSAEREVRGIFPKACTLSPKDPQLCDVYAEILSLLPAVESAFIHGKADDYHTASSLLLDVSSSNLKQHDAIVSEEVETYRKRIIESICLCERKLQFPLQIRSSEPFAFNGVVLLDEHKKLVKEIRNLELAPARARTEKFNIAIEFGRLPPQTTIYLASQSLSVSEIASGTQANLTNGNTDSSVTGGSANQFSWTEACFRAYGDVSTNSGPSSKFAVEFHSCSRLSENVFFAEGRDSSKNTVIFSELKPFNPTDERVLLCIATSRVGAMQTKKYKTLSHGDNGINAVRRPVAVACLDITKDLLPILLPRKKLILSATARLAKRRKETSQTSHSVILTSCNEEFEDDCFLRLYKETPSSFVDFINQYSTPAVQSDLTANAALPPLANSAIGVQGPNTTDFASGESLEIEIKDIRPVDLQPYHIISREFSQWVVARPYGLSEPFSGGAEFMRNDLFVTLLSGNFEKSGKKNDFTVEVEVTLRDASGHVLPWICDLPPDAKGYTSNVYYHSNRPRWSELLRIALPWRPEAAFEPTGTRYSQTESLSGDSVSEMMEAPSPGSFYTPAGLVPGVHLRFVSRHRSTPPDTKDKILGVSYLLLQPGTDPVLLSDRDLTLMVHKMTEEDIEQCLYLQQKSFDSDQMNSSSGSGSGALGNPSTTSASGIMASLANFSGRTPRPETLRVRTLLCSAQYTTDEHLAKVLQWRQHEDDLILCLHKLVLLTEKSFELRKFTLPVVDSLLQILASLHLRELPTSESPLQGNAYRLGCSVISVLTKIYRDIACFPTLQEQLTSYLNSGLFRDYFVHNQYLTIIYRMLLDPQSPSRQVGQGEVKFEWICTTLRWAFQIIVRSRQLEMAAFEGDSPEKREQAKALFERRLNDFISGIFWLATSDSLDFFKGHIFKHISEIIAPLSLVHPVMELAHVFKSLIDSTLQSQNLPTFSLLTGCIKSVLMEDGNCRRLILPSIVESMKPVFATSLDRALTSSRQGSHQCLEYLLEILPLFLRRFVQFSQEDSDRARESTVSDDSTGGISLRQTEPSAEMHELFVRQGFLRWVLQELARVLRFIDCASRSRPNSDLLGTSSSTQLDLSNVQFLELQPILGFLASSLTTILQQMRPTDWRALLLPDVSSKPSRHCPTCMGLELIDAFDLLDELMNVFLLMHIWSAYPPPTPPSNEASSRPQTAPPPPLYMEREQAWVQMLGLQSRVELKVLEDIFEEILRPFFMWTAPLPPDDEFPRLDADHRFSVLLINQMQYCLGSFCENQAHLRLEDLPTVSRIRTAPLLEGGLLGDLRVSGCKLLQRLWNAIADSHKGIFIEAFVPTFITMAKVPLTEIRNICVDLLVDTLRINPLIAEPFLIREMDRVMQSADDNFADEMLGLLTAHLPPTRRFAKLSVGVNGAYPASLRIRRHSPVPHQPPPLTLSGPTADNRRLQVIEYLIQQIRYLREYRDYINRPSEIGGMLAINNLRTFYESLARKDMTLRYLFRLEKLHEQCSNDVERGYTLENISNQFKWSDFPVEVSELSAEYAKSAELSSSALREHLLLRSLDFLQSGGDWEEAIRVCGQLAEFYKMERADFARLSHILARESGLYEYIVNRSDRPSYNYYVIRFSGGGFPSFISDSIVYRTTETIGNVTALLSAQFPDAKVVSNIASPDVLDAAVQEGDDATPTIYLISNLQPEPEIPPEWKSVSHLDSRIKAYYAKNQVKHFIRRWHLRPSQNEEDRERPVCVEVRYVISETLPNILPFMPVKETTSRFLSQLDLYVSDVLSMVKSLTEAMEHVADFASQPNLFTVFVDKLTSSICSPVSGGVEMIVKKSESDRRRSR